MTTKATAKKAKRGPKKGSGGRPPGPKRVQREVSILETTDQALQADGLTPSQALDSLKWR